MHFFNRHMAVGVGRLVGRRLFLHQMRILLCARTPYTRGGSCFVLFTPEAGPALYMLELLFGRDCWALYIKDVIQHF